MKIWKLVSGILSIIMAAFVLFQSSIAGLSNTLSENGEAGGSAGLIVSVMLLTSGIVSIVIRNSNSKGGNIAIIVLCLIAAVLGFTGAGSYSDLKVWSAWCVILAIMAVVSILINKKEGGKNEKIS